MIVSLLLWFLLSQLVLGICLWLNVRHLYKYPNLFGSPIFGNLYYFYRHLMITSLDSHYKYYGKVSEDLGHDIFFTFAVGRLAVILSCPHLIKEISYNPHASNKPAPYSYVNSIVEGILTYTSSDSEWKTRRKEANLALKKHNINGPFRELNIKCGKDIIEEIEEEPNPVDIHYWIYNKFLDTVKGTFFGMSHFTKADREVIDELLKGTDKGSKSMANRIYGFIFYYAAMLFDRLFLPKGSMHREEMMNEVIEKSKKIMKDPKCQDHEFGPPLSVMIAIRNANLNRSKRELEKEINELVLVPWHSTSITMSGAATYLAIFQEIQQKVWEEQFQIFGDSERDPTPDDLKEMVYLERFLKETLRFLGPTTIAKMVTEDINLGGITIPAGFTVSLLLYKMRMDHRYWKDPEVFNPDRFLDEIEHVPTYAYAPFGVGIRNCPGMPYAYSNLKIVTSTIIRKYKLSTDMKFEDLKYYTDLMNRIINPPLIHIEKRILLAKT